LSKVAAPAPSYADLEAAAREVLERNRQGSWTCPSITGYPHQWLWDSCFIAIGVARYDPQRAASELRALFRGQWANGMLPNMIFRDGRNDLGSRRIWNSKNNAQAPRDVATSCITQPPLPAIAALRVAQALPAPDRESFLAELLPKLTAYHAWLYRERDLHDTGLITLIHPWECGLDTTPPWMEALNRMPLPWWLKIVVRLHLARAVRAIRNDTRYLPVAQRSTDDDGLRMLVLAARAKRHDFRLAQMPPRSSVLLEDLGFNSIFIAANRSLELIAGELDRPLPSALQCHFRRTAEALEQLWDEGTGQYYSRDAVTRELIKLPTIATFLPLWAAAPSPTRAKRLIELLCDPTRFWPRYPVPSVPIDAPDFQEARYWQGPTWINTGWAIVEGLLEYDYDELAEQLRLLMLGLVEHGGFFEYFSPLTGEGFGTDSFSWTAALVIDLLAAHRSHSPS
jgi:hypothetical protein